MLRTSLTAMVLSVLLASAGFAGDCMSCGTAAYGGDYGWDNYCDGDGGCGGMMGRRCGCDRCCFPLAQRALQRIGCVVDLLIPDPCCRPRCARVDCCQPTCGIEPGCGAAGYGGMPMGPSHMSDPFIDDHRPMPPTPTPDKGARARNPLGTPRMTYGNSTRSVLTPARSTSKPAAKPTAAPKRSTVAQSVAKRNVLKVAYEEEPAEIVVRDASEIDAPPAAPASIQNARKSSQSSARYAAKPVVKASATQQPANPLR